MFTFPSAPTALMFLSLTWMAAPDGSGPRKGMETQQANRGPARERQLRQPIPPQVEAQERNDRACQLAQEMANAASANGYFHVYAQKLGRLYPDTPIGRFMRFGVLP